MSETQPAKSESNFGRLLEELALRFPTPIADSVQVMIALSNTPLLERVIEVVRTITRLLGVYALSARLQSPPPSGRDEPEVRALVSRLMSKGLEDAEWLSLVRALCREYASNPEAHPIPEMVQLLAKEGRLDRFLGGAPSDRPAPQNLQEALVIALEELEGFLVELSFLAHQEILVVESASEEEASGLLLTGETPFGGYFERRSTKLTGAKPGDVILLQRQGKPRPPLWLSPLACFLPPVPGDTPELFLFEGRRRDKALLVARPSGAARQEEAPLEALRRIVGEIPAPADGAPALVVPQREREIQTFLNRLHEEPLLAIAGPMGAGKSAFLFDGVVAELGEGWRYARLHPTQSPFSALDAALGNISEVESDVTKLLTAAMRSPEEGRREIHEWLQKRRLKLLIAVDEFQELFTLGVPTEEQERFVDLLAALARESSDPIRVAIVLREDFLGAAASLRALKGLISRRLFIIDKPADPPPPAPVILSEEAILARADKTINSLPPEEQRLAWEILQILVTPRGTRAALTREEILASVSDSARSLRVFERLKTDGFFNSYSPKTTSGGVAQGELLELTSEALVKWPRFELKLAEAKEYTRQRERLKEAVQAWADADFAKRKLWDPEEIVSFKNFSKRHSLILTEKEERFLRESATEEHKALSSKQRNPILLVAVAAAVVLGFSALFLQNSALRQEVSDAQNRAAQQANEVKSARAKAEDANQRLAQEAQKSQRLLHDVYLDPALTEFRLGRPERSLAILNEVLKTSAESTESRYLVARALAGSATLQTVVSQPNFSTASLSVSGKYALTGGADGSVSFFDLSKKSSPSLLTGHQDSITVLSFSPNEKLFATASEDGALKLWSAADKPSEKATLSGHTNALRAVSFSADGTLLASADLGGVVKLWSTETGALLFDLSAEVGKVQAAVFSPDGQSLACAGDAGAVQIFSTVTGKESATAKKGGSLRALAYRPDGTMLAATGSDKTVWVLDAKSGKEVAALSGHVASVSALSFSPDGETLASGDADGTVLLWSLSQRAIVQTLGQSSAEISALAFDQDGVRIAAASFGDAARFYEAKTGRTLSSLPGQCVFGASLEHTLCAQEDGRVAVWSTIDHRDERAYAIEGSIESMAFRADGKALALGGTGGSILQVRSAEDGTLISIPLKEMSAFDGTTTTPRGVHALAFSPDGRLLATAGEPLSASEPVQSIILRDAQTGDIIATFSGAQDTIRTLAFSPDGRFLAASGDDTVVRLFDISSKEASLLGNHSDAVRSLDFSADGALLVSASYDGTLQLWDVAKKAQKRKISVGGSLESAKLSADGSMVAAAGTAGLVALFRVEDGMLLRSFDGQTSDVISIALTPDGSLLAALGDNGQLSLWETRRGRLLEEHSHRGAKTLALDKKGEQLASIGDDQTLRFWPISVDARPKNEITEQIRCTVPFRFRDDGVVFAASAEMEGCTK